ncbi:MAG TPA: HlyD family secretion protein [Candidatus Acidoferrales bacterium]|nr:HlyD family secretion protein [Candidatus Acidoferrales bacterium]
MTEELELEQTALDDSPKPKLVETKPATHGAPAKPKRRLSRWLALFAMLGIAAGGAVFWLQSLAFETTDDAQVDGHFDSVSSRISGTVVYVNPKAENNQFVQAGTLLVELDPRDYEAELDHAKADLDTRKAEAVSARVTVPIVDASAFNRLRASEAAAQQATSAVNEAEANLAAAQHRLQQDRATSERAERDRVRYQALVEKHEISRSEYDARQTESVSAAQAVEADLAAIQSSRQKIAQAHSLVAQREAEVEAARTAPQQLADAKAKTQTANGHQEQAAAVVRTARLNLGYTKIYAPVSGVVGRKTVELGHRIQPGQALMILVPLDDVWITANFKETQLKGMKAGEPVRIHVDTLDRDFNGYIENMPGAAGPLFSLFPPENATGNYVKVVQRFPVRIRVNPNEDPQHLLRPGMSVEPRVKVR